MSLFKRLFNIRKANKETGDIKTEFEVQDIRKGYILDYDTRSWEVTDVAIYTWDNGVKDYEYTIFDGTEKLYLNYESVDGKLSVYWEGKINEIWSTGKKEMRKRSDMTDKEFAYGGKIYYFFGEGAAKVKSTKETYYLENWLFTDESEEQIISFNRYNDGSMDAYIGKKLSNHAISNILAR